MVTKTYFRRLCKDCEWCKVYTLGGVATAALVSGCGGDDFFAESTAGLCLILFVDDKVAAK
jgi:hypothetical protein